MGPAVGLAVLAVAIVFAAFCLVDLGRASQVRYLPKWGWAIIVCVSVPWGGLAYLTFGRSRGGPAVTWTPPPAPPAPARRPAARPVLIEADRLTKRFGPVTAVDRLSFTVRPGLVTGFLGPNGAGKTTTMRMILGLETPTAGTALVGGRPYARIIRPLREVGSLLDAGALHGGRTALSHLLAVARSNGIGRARVTEVLGLAGLESIAGRRVQGFSLGMKQRLGIAAALLGDPPVLIFDEPAIGLDAEGIRWIRGLFTGLAAEGRTVLVSSHLMGEMAQTAGHLIIIGRGRLLADMATRQFVAANAHHDVLVRSPRAAELTGLLDAAGAAVTAEPDGGLAVTGLDAPAIADLAACRGLPVHELTPRQASLEEAYLDLTGDSTEYRSLPQGAPS
ncbi:MAG: ABC transporter ATP-binding protein [Streptosporangiaceae bacterium]